MKNVLFSIAFLFFCIQTVNSQIDWGMKGGLNFNSSGDITFDVGDIVQESQSDIGYHVGAFLKFKLTKLYIKPELVYTKTKSKYDTTSFEMSKIDMPLLVGFTLIRPLSIFVGPSFQYVLDTDLKGVSLGAVENEISVGYNIGAAVQLGRFGIDIRYENGFSENQANFLNVNASISTTPEQFILSVFVKI